jgi:hypothetical protein
MKRSRWRYLLTALAVVLPVSASAHVFVQPYALPVPLWMYLYACAATLLISFALVAYFAGGTVAAPALTVRPVDWTGRRRQAAWRWSLRLAKGGALASLLVTVVAGLIGTTDPAANISMTLFWVAFLLGLTYLTAIVGDIYSAINPWRTLVEAVEAAGIDLSRPRVRFPRALGYWPAVAFYVALVWIELFVLPKPSVLGAALVVYTASVFLGAFLFGSEIWFQRGELFTVFFRAVGTMAPVEYTDAQGETTTPRVRLRRPLLAALQEPPAHFSFVLFVLFMLSSTTYDAIHETYFWVNLYWQHLVPWLYLPWGGSEAVPQDVLIRGYVAYQRLGLVLSPFLYFIAYLLVLAAAKVMTGTRVPLRTMTHAFAMTLVPIALVYHMTHYYMILASGLPSLWPLATDPFGWGWHLLGTMPVRVEAPFSMGVIWHTQVALMLAGHVAAVYLAHLVALRVFPSHRQGILSQLPMLLLMVAYTCLGLWVLSLPLAVPQVLPLG